MDHLPEKPIPPLRSGGEDIPPAQVIANGELVQLIALFTSLLAQSESRILEGVRHATGQLGEDLAANSQAAKDRWSKHEHEHAEETKRWETHITKAEGRWKIEDDEEFKFDARVQPVRAFLQWCWRSRKDIIILILGILAILGISGEWIQVFK